MKRAVITGIGVVSPLGSGWQNWVNGLRSGISATKTISLFDPQNPWLQYFAQATGEFAGRTGTPLACQVAAEVPDFVPSRWLDKRDLDRVPRVVPMALAAVNEAWQNSGLAMSNAREREVDVIIGSGGGGFSFAEEQFAHWFAGDSKALSPFAVSSSIAGMVSSEISIAYGFRGRSHSFSDGCTSSSDALGNALDLIRNGRAHTVISGGADAPITPGTLAAFSLMRAIPTKYNDRPTQASRPFDRARDGFVLGEGAWILVVEELERAKARGATIWAEIAGYGATCEAYHRVALGAPDEAARAMQKALDDAATEAAAIDYVNLHGTATALNDPLETAAVKLALGKRANLVPASATKSQIGHPQGASGAAGVAATLAAMQNNFIPPTINLEQAAEGCDLDYVPNRARWGEVQTALCNCLGFGSKNAAIVLRKLL